mmetsp:Transcript_22008/g.66882  ORF Transcript_22008/g.66882 Transcript_22008/m.66882 type:complete len:259 (-) Transcript_22008:5538-6314(-)
MELSQEQASRQVRALMKRIPVCGSETVCLGRWKRVPNFHRLRARRRVGSSSVPTIPLSLRRRTASATHVLTARRTGGSPIARRPRTRRRLSLAPADHLLRQPTRRRACHRLAWARNHRRCRPYSRIVARHLAAGRFPQRATPRRSGAISRLRCRQAFMACWSCTLSMRDKAVRPRTTATRWMTTQPHHELSAAREVRCRQAPITAWRKTRQRVEACHSFNALNCRACATRAISCRPRRVRMAYAHHEHNPRNSPWLRR